MTQAGTRSTGGWADTPIGLIAAIAVGFVAWLALVWYGTTVTVLRTPREELVGVATWGVSIVIGGLFLVYTWTVAAAIIERERLRSVLRRGIALADQALEEARDAASRSTQA